VKQQPKVPTPNWHANWELSAVISGHLGWVRSIAFDPSNEWFATGSVDRTIKVCTLPVFDNYCDFFSSSSS
jgi:pleiotropic regulator 1